MIKHIKKKYVKKRMLCLILFFIIFWFYIFWFIMEESEEEDEIIDTDWIEKLSQEEDLYNDFYK